MFKGMSSSQFNYQNSKSRSNDHLRHNYRVINNGKRLILRLRYSVGLKKQNRTSHGKLVSRSCSKKQRLDHEQELCLGQEGKNSAEVKQVPENILGQLKIVLAYWRSRGFPENASISKRCKEQRNRATKYNGSLFKGGRHGQVLCHGSTKPLDSINDQCFLHPATT